VVVPEGLEAGEPEEDDLNRGRVRLALAFALRPGSYATMLVKRCTYDM
jgi:tRNA pseudouridine13 synthase